MLNPLARQILDDSVFALIVSFFSQAHRDVHILVQHADHSNRISRERSEKDQVPFVFNKINTREHFIYDRSPSVTRVRSFLNRSYEPSDVSFRLRFAPSPFGIVPDFKQAVFRGRKKLNLHPSISAIWLPRSSHRYQAFHTLTRLLPDQPSVHVATKATCDFPRVRSLASQGRECIRSPKNRPRNHPFAPG